MDKAAAALTSLPPASSLDVHWPKAPAISHLPEVARLTAGCCLPSSHLIGLAPAVFGGRERGRRHAWDPGELAKGPQRYGPSMGTDFLPSTTFPDAAVVNWSHLQ